MELKKDAEALGAAGTDRRKRHHSIGRLAKVSP
jgi:hypothetical protein